MNSKSLYFFARVLLVRGAGVFVRWLAAVCLFRPSSKILLQNRARASRESLKLKQLKLSKSNQMT